ncbi:general L-amino acid transport system substrate-binding protein [Pseudorhodoferax soli]|uniref:General L-amino acid transport system substrate-binding protein n=2 Tax=Pseudorhodoferax soli TaxID=545864 RepID=A0A368X523_9BURK|nr:general L-amino acid transport system substrate-binding protein [Pseudorhodoferax soli]
MAVIRTRSVMASWRRFAAGGALLVLAVGAAQAGPTLEAVRARDALLCGISPGMLGFSHPGTTPGHWEGMDVDICRAVAAAVLGSGDKVKFVHLQVDERLPALREGRFDILAFAASYTMSRDTSMGAQATVVTYYDGQGFMVPTASKVRNTRQLRGKPICVTTTGSSEQTLQEYSDAQKMGFKLLRFARFKEAAEAYLARRCAAISADATSLAVIRRTQTPLPADHLILPELISKEPLGPLVRRGDDAWALVVTWVIQGLIAAEEHGLTRANVVEQAASNPNAEVQRMLGRSGDSGKMIGLERDWLLNALRATGNYGEIFARNVGVDSPLGLPRGLNALWSHGGLQYALPIR